MLLVAALGTLILWLLGLAVAERQWIRHFQANTERRRPVLSTVFLGQELWRNHRFKVRLAKLFEALKHLKLLVIQEAQLRMKSWGSLSLPIYPVAWQIRRIRHGSPPILGLGNCRSRGHVSDFEFPGPPGRTSRCAVLSRMDTESLRMRGHVRYPSVGGEGTGGCS